MRLDPGADKRGLWLAPAPVWGADASQVEQLWYSAAYYVLVRRRTRSQGVGGV